MLWVCKNFQKTLFPMLCLNAVELTDEFPKGQPGLVLRSVYHCMDGLPCQSVVTDYPYSPRWGSEEMAERLRSASTHWLNSHSTVSCSRELSHSWDTSHSQLVPCVCERIKKTPKIDLLVFHGCKRFHFYLMCPQKMNVCCIIVSDLLLLNHAGAI